VTAPWPCRCVDPSPHGRLKGLCRCGGYQEGFGGPPPRFEPIPKKPVTTIKPRVPEENERP
jgi:hypothetical protein